MQPAKQETNKPEAVLKSALRRFLKFGVRRTAVADIAKDVGLSTSAVTALFKDKEALVLACYDRHLRAHRREAKKITESTLEARGKLRIYLLNRFYAWREVNNATPQSFEFTSVLVRLGPDRINEEEDLLVETLAKIISIGVAGKVFRVDKPLKEAEIAAMCLNSCFPLPGLRRPRQAGEKELLELIDWLLAKWRRR